MSQQGKRKTKSLLDF